MCAEQVYAAEPLCNVQPEKYFVADSVSFLKEQAAGKCIAPTDYPVCA